jgi:shikimate dehydrogenase
LLDELSDDAAAIGAVNTVVFSAGKRIGHNTDCFGFAESFRRGLGDVARNNVVLLGAGGAGSAVANAALQSGVGRLVIHDPDSARAVSLAGRLSNRFGPHCVATITDLAAAMAKADGLIQATPIGMLGYPGLPLPIELLRSSHWVAEIVYFPLETELLRRARALGCRTLDGGGMAVFQAAEAFRLFTGVTPDYERMLNCFAAIKDTCK